MCMAFPASVHSERQDKLRKIANLQPFVAQKKELASGENLPRDSFVRPQVSEKELIAMSEKQQLVDGSTLLPLYSSAKAQDTKSVYRKRMVFTTLGLLILGGYKVYSSGQWECIL